MAAADEKSCTVAVLDGPGVQRVVSEVRREEDAFGSECQARARDGGEGARTLVFPQAADGQCSDDLGRQEVLRVVIYEVGQVEGQVEHVLLLLLGRRQRIIRVLLEDQVARRARQRAIACT